MTLDKSQDETSWWAHNDTSVHKQDSRVSYFVDGQSAFFALCCALLRARSFIYLANWGMTADFALVRGKEHRAGPDGSAAQEALLTLLRSEDLDESAILFWQTHQLSIKEVLGYAASRSVDVKVLLWNSLPLPSYSHYHPRETCTALSRVGVTCLLDNSARGILHHPAESLHQKLAVVDGQLAFVGGLDPMVEKNADFDRWDTSEHPFATDLRQTTSRTTPHPWHDVYAQIEGAAAADIEYNFRQRWNAVVKRYERWQLLPERRRFYQQAAVAPHAAPTAVEGTGVVQIARTIPKHTYHFQPRIVQGIFQLYLQAIRNAQKFLYLENQYLWLHAYTGIDISFLGKDSPEMEEIMQALIAALHRGVSLALVLPDHPAPGRAFSDACIARIRREAPDALAGGRFQAFCLGASADVAGGRHYRPIYVHAKVAIVDDLWVTVGSANLNNRGMRDDTEINVATLDAELARSLRLRLWGEHLGQLTADECFALNTFLHSSPLQKQSVGVAIIWQNIQNAWQDSNRAHFFPGRETFRSWQRVQETLQDPLQGIHLMQQQAQDNLASYKSRQPLKGHLLPYLLEDEARQQGLNFTEEHGWLEEPAEKPVH